MLYGNGRKCIGQYCMRCGKLGFVLDAARNVDYIIYTWILCQQMNCTVHAESECFSGPLASGGTRGASPVSDQ
jgi:hypothetical protein